ncbi:FAD dependent oxidoreductase [Trichoderma camerunense]
MSHEAIPIVVVGAGVSGLTTALLLSRQKNPEYTSPWAGATFIPVAQVGTKTAAFEKATYHEFERLLHIPESGISLQDATVYQRKKDAGSTRITSHAKMISREPWSKQILDCQVVSDTELHQEMEIAFNIKSMSVNPKIYLPFLVFQCLGSGVVIKQGTIWSLKDAANMHASGEQASLIVNCTGLSASSLNGLGPDGFGDKTVSPVSGQTVLVRNKVSRTVVISGTEDGDDELLYIINQGKGGATVLGGSHHQGNWNFQPDPRLAQRIMERAVNACPELGNGNGTAGLDVILHGVGLRPGRLDGPRIGASWVDGILVVHNYGHGGTGYKISYGCAEEVVDIVADVLRDASHIPREKTLYSA